MAKKNVEAEVKAWHLIAEALAAEMKKDIKAEVAKNKKEAIS